MKKDKQLIFFSQPDFLSNIKRDFDLFFNNKKIKMALYLGGVPFVLVFLIIIIFWTKLPPEIPLFYSRPWGENQLAKKYWLLLLLSFYFLIMILNLRLASLFFKKEALLAKILVWTTVVLAALVSTTIIRIILVVL